MSEIAVAGFPARSNAAPSAPMQPSLARTGFVAEIQHGIEAYCGLAAEWNGPASRQDGALLFQLPQILSIWSRHFLDSRSTLATIVVRDRQRVVLIWPVFIEKRLPLRIVSGAGSPIGQYDDLMIDRDTDAKAAFAAALAALKDALKPDVIMFERVRADAALRRALPEEFQKSNQEAAPFVDLSNGLAAALASRKCGVAKTQRKRVKRFAKEGSVEMTLAAAPETAAVWLEEALALKREWLRSSGRVSRAFMMAETGDCLVELARTLCSPASSPRMIVSRLSLNSATAAIEVGFLHGETFHLYLRAFSPSVAHLGPGNILTERMLEWCAAQGVKRYDMLAPGSRNKSEWQNGETEVADFTLPLTPRGQLYAATIPSKVMPALRDAFYALPERVRATIAGAALRL